MKIKYKPTAVNQLKKIPKQELRKIIRKLELLADDPFVGKPLKGEFEGLYSLRAWPYRIIYLIESDSGTITVFLVTHRQSAYK